MVLKDINLSVEKSSLVVIRGPNGAGKTTLLKVIAGLILPDTGTVTVDGVSLERPQELHAKVGLVTGNNRSFYARLSGLENLRFFGATHNLYGKNLDARIQELADHLEARPFLHVRYQEYSQGMKARLGFMRALLHDPKILLLDEPFRSMDSGVMNHLKDWIDKELIRRQKKTVLMVSNREEEFQGWHGRLLCLDQGRIIGEKQIEGKSGVPQEEETVFQ